MKVHMGEKELEEAEGGARAVVLKLELHCQGCAKKVRRSISQLEGIEKVKADCSAKKLTVTGNVDPTWLRHTVEAKTKKKVELISPLPKPHAHNHQINKEAAHLNTVVMKTKLHCDGCAHKIKRIISNNFHGVELVTTDIHRDLITVIGRMDVEGLVAYLREKLKRGIDIIAPKKDIDNKKGKDGNDGDKKEKSGIGEEAEEEKTKKVELKPEISDGEKHKDKEKTKMEVEVSKMEQHSYNTQTHYAMPISMHSQSNGNHHEYDHGYPIMDHMIHYNTQGPPLPPPTFLNINNDHMFSDENPNGCFIM